LLRFTLWEYDLSSGRAVRLDANGATEMTALDRATEFTAAIAVFVFLLGVLS
jgi:hypothetical protein